MTCKHKCKQNIYITQRDNRSELIWKSPHNERNKDIMKKAITTGFTIMLTLNMTAAAFASDQQHSIMFDFEQSDEGFTSIYADYPNNEGVEEFYEFKNEYTDVPIDGAGKGLYISGNNHCADLFMGYVKKLSGFSPEKTYRFNVTFKLATDVKGGMVGVGGAPGESVTVKCGVTPTEPKSEPTGELDYYRMNIDTGIQANSGKDMVVVGDMVKPENNNAGGYEFKDFSTEIETTANSNGEVFLIIGTDSGFEATTSYYLDDISINWTEEAPTYVTRADAVSLLFGVADRPSADTEDCIFNDIDKNASYAEAVVWAQQNGYMSGYGNGQFGPEDKINVEQAMVMIYRFFGCPDIDDSSVLKKYEDGSQVSSWARDAVAWNIENGLLNVDKKISPQSPITEDALVYAISQIVVAN